VASHREASASCQRGGVEHFAGHDIMAGISRLLPSLPIAALILAAACSNVADKQWYKPNENYTAADFARDSTACTGQEVEGPRREAA
jgi:hypothetical protein